jgi:hypothetical protein
MRRRILIVALVLGLAACGSQSDPPPERLEDRGIEDIAPEADEQEVVDLYAEWTRCIAEDKVPNDECPNPAGGENPPDD